MRSVWIAVIALLLVGCKSSEVHQYGPFGEPNDTIEERQETMALIAPLGGHQHMKCEYPYIYPVWKDGKDDGCEVTPPYGAVYIDDESCNKGEVLELRRHENQKCVPDHGQPRIHGLKG